MGREYCGVIAGCLPNREFCELLIPSVLLHVRFTAKGNLKIRDDIEKLIDAECMTAFAPSLEI